MSQLTSEEREYIAHCKQGIHKDAAGLLLIIDRLSARLKEYEADRKEARDCTATFWMHYGEKVGQAHLDAEDRVIRLSARCEEVQKEREAITRHGMKLQSNLSALLAAVEKRLSKGHNDTCALVLCEGMTRKDGSKFTESDCSCGHSTLSTIAAGIRGKG